MRIRFTFAGASGYVEPLAALARAARSLLPVPGQSKSLGSVRGRFAMARVA